MNVLEWLKRLPESLTTYMDALRVPGQVGRFVPCVEGCTAAGTQAALGSTCFALKIYYILGLWEELPPAEQQDWITFLRSFQVDSDYSKNAVTHNAFIDPIVVKTLVRQIPWSQRFISRFFPKKNPTYLDKVIIAETKQAIATLAQVGATTVRPYLGFPATPEDISNYLSSLDWNKPWAAGGQAAALVVFLKTQSPLFLRQTEVQELLYVCAEFFESLADPHTGGYFRGRVPDHDEVINGAMKVLTALHWLDEPIHYPERLVDTCRGQLPSPKGCHLVDAIYVLHRCLHECRYDKARIAAYCSEVLQMIEQHHNSDGGFSYNIGSSQTHYYGVPISQGLTESDIHGTCLLTWAIAMSLEILEENRVGWRVITP